MPALPAGRRATGEGGGGGGGGVLPQPGPVPNPIIILPRPLPISGGRPQPTWPTGSPPDGPIDPGPSPAPIYPPPDPTPLPPGPSPIGIEPPGPPVPPDPQPVPEPSPVPGEDPGVDPGPGDGPRPNSDPVIEDWVAGGGPWGNQCSNSSPLFADFVVDLSDLPADATIIDAIAIYVLTLSDPDSDFTVTDQGGSCSSPVPFTPVIHWVQGKVRPGGPFVIHAKLDWAQGVQGCIRLYAFVGSMVLPIES